MLNILGFTFDSHSIKIKYFKINPINTFSPISTEGGVGVQILDLLVGMFYNMPKVLSYKFQSHSIKIENF